MSKERFEKFLDSALIKVLKAEGLKNSLEKIALVYNEFFPESKIWFAEKLGKRVSYITGAGQESFLKAREFELKDRYLLYLENIELSENEREAFINLVNLIIYLKGDKNEFK